MKWDDYRKAMDELPFDPDFQARTVELLRLNTQKESKKEDFPMKKKWIHKIAAVAAVIALLTVSAYAAVRLLSPSQVAEFAGKPLLADAFQSEDAVILNESAETGDFRVTLAGLVSGKGLDSWSGSVDQERTYAVLSLERLDGVSLDQQSFPLTSYTLTPLVSGYVPWALNNWTLNAGLQGLEQDGVYYYLLDTQSLEMFADHTVYLAFYEGGAPSRELFAMEADGAIVFQPDYTGPHALFTLPLDAGKADSAAVDAFIADSGFDREWFTHYEPVAEEPDVSSHSAETGNTIVPVEAGDLDWMTPDEYAAYMEAELAAMEAQVNAGTLSQANLDREMGVMEANLAGIREGSLGAIRLENGGVSVVTSPEAAAANGWIVSYGQSEEGITAFIEE